MSNQEKKLKADENKKNSILQEMKAGVYYQNNHEVVCCKYKNGSATEYGKMTREDCTGIFFGDVVDDSNCK